MVDCEAIAMDSIQLSSLLTQVMDTQELERRALATRLQEDIGQALAALAVHLRVIERRCKDVESTAVIAESRTLLTTALHDLEGITTSLNPPALQTQGLGPALENYAQEFARQTHIGVELDFEVLPRLGAEVEINLFRVVQAAMEAIFHYAVASSISLVLRQADHAVVLLVEDDSPGCSPEITSSFRFLQIVQRVDALGGVCELAPEAPDGMRVRVIVPLPDTEAT